MDKLQDKLLKLKETLEKGMKNGGIGGQGSVKAGAVLPSISKPKAPGSTNSSTPSVGQAPTSKKNPVKQAEQIQNKDIKDRKLQEAQSALKGPQLSKEDLEVAPDDSNNRQTYLEIFKADQNGQWSIEKAYKDRETAVPGVSEMGIEARRGTGRSALETGYGRVHNDPNKHKETAREIARENIKETKSIKPKLPDAKKSDEIEKSGYKGYTPEDNARRKKNNLSEGTGIKSMDRIKRYGGSGPNSAAKEAARMKAASKKNPVKTYSKEEIDAINRERSLNKK